MDKKYREQAQDCIQQGEDWIDDNRNLAMQFIAMARSYIDKNAIKHALISMNKQLTHWVP